ncbi:MAG: hypothetical protein PUK83_00520 [Clostridia bacterium]|nr:hypothetical protein [Clostridia bacterium]MDY5263926.1 hypothetical protein [Eubacteriales bacterium]
MQTCKYCSKEFEGKFCPYCGRNVIDGSTNPLNDEIVKEDISEKVIPPIQTDFVKETEKREETAQIEESAPIVENGVEEQNVATENDIISDKVNSDESENYGNDEYEKSKKKEKPVWVMKNGAKITVRSSYKKRGILAGLSLMVMVIAIVVVTGIFIAPNYSKYWLNSFDITTATITTMEQRFGQSIVQEENFYVWAKDCKTKEQLDSKIKNEKNVDIIVVTADNGKVKTFAYLKTLGEKKINTIKYSTTTVSSKEELDNITFEATFTDGSIAKAYIGGCSAMDNQINFENKGEQLYYFSDEIYNYSVKINVV